MAVCGSADGSVRTYGARNSYIYRSESLLLCNNHSDIVARRHTSTRMYTYALRKIIQMTTTVAPICAVRLNIC